MKFKTWIVLNSDRVVSKLIIKREKIINERSQMLIASDLVSNEKRTVIRQEEEWREERRVMHQLLSGSNLKIYADMQKLENVNMLRRYLREPGCGFLTTFDMPRSFFIESSWNTHWTRSERRWMIIREWQSSLSRSSTVVTWISFLRLASFLIFYNLDGITERRWARFIAVFFSNDETPSERPWVRARRRPRLFVTFFFIRIQDTLTMMKRSCIWLRLSWQLMMTTHAWRSTRSWWPWSRISKPRDGHAKRSIECARAVARSGFPECPICWRCLT